MAFVGQGSAGFPFCGGFMAGFNHYLWQGFSGLLLTQ
jgi:hypothetical protein